MPLYFLWLLVSCSDETFTFSVRTAISLGAAATEVSLYIYAAHRNKALYKQRDGYCFGIQGPCDVDFSTP